ncbi:MAG TPA: DMT family transporter [Casimicrobiaceae bacterium]|nr:DMT family transporter [Casimicrobiaceae bacterium]
MPPAAARRRAIAMMIVAATCWSSGGFLVRRQSLADPWEIVFWRSTFMVLFVAGVLAVIHGRRTAAAIRAVGAPGLASGVFLACTFFFFIASLTRTTVANTFVLMSVAPFTAAIAGRVFLREAVPPRTWLAMAVAFAGIVVMFGDAIDSGQLVGNLLALGVPCFFAAQVTVLRKYHATVDMLPQVMIAGIVSIAVAAPLASPFTATPGDLAVLAVMGSIQLGAGCLLATAASRQLTATELGLLGLLEPILGPIWVWALMGEHPGTTTLAGGAIVLAAVIANEAFAAWRTRSREPAAGLPPVG